MVKNFFKAKSSLAHLLNKFESYLSHPENTIDFSKQILFISILVQYLFFYNELDILFSSNNLNLKILYIMLCISTVLILLKFHTPLFILISCICHISITKISPYVFGGWASAVPFIYLIFFLHAYNLDYLKHNKSTLPFYTSSLLAYAGAIYFNANIERFNEHSWLSGAMVESILSNTFFSRFYDMINFQYFNFELKLLTYLTLILESMGVFLFLMPKKYRKFLAALLICLHLSILLLVKVQIWSMIMISLLVLGFSIQPWDNSKKNYYGPVFRRTSILFIFMLVYILTLNKQYTSEVNAWLEKTNLMNFRYMRVFQKDKSVDRFRTKIYGFNKKNKIAIYYDSTDFFLNSPNRIENRAVDHIVHFRQSKARGRFTNYDCLFYKSLFGSDQSFVVVNKYVKKSVSYSISIFKCSQDAEFKFKEIDLI